MRTFFAYLFFPLSMLYGIVIYFRNRFYDFEWLSSKKHKATTIGVGNLRVGGTGKTPHVEYLVSVLSEVYNVAVLSRGYGRKTKGFRFVEINDRALEVGDEPLQMKSKFPEIPFAVCEDRNKGIERLEKEIKDLEIVILDDSFQHRALSLDLSVLLTSYSNPFFKDKIIPFGLLREHKNGYKRADYIIITKSPVIYSMGDRVDFESYIRPKKYQKVFFSHIDYKPLYALFEKESTISLEGNKVILLTAIADNKPIVNYISEKTTIIDKLEYPDHYNFTNKDIDKLINRYNSQKQEKAIIITTEKDSMRLRGFDQLMNLPIYVLPIALTITSSVSKSVEFRDIILDDVRKNKSYSKLY